MTARVVPDKPGWWWGRLDGEADWRAYLVETRDYRSGASALVVWRPMFMAPHRVDQPCWQWRAPVLTPEEAADLLQRAEAAERTIERDRLRWTEMVGELVTALGILPPGEDAVRNFEAVIEAAGGIRQRAEAADAELAQLRTRHAELRHLAGALVSDAEDGTSKLLKRWPVLAAYIEGTANQVRNHLKSEERS